MNNKEFDNKIKQLVDSYEEPLDEMLWGGIEKRLNRNRRLLFVRRSAYVAVAASLVLGAFILIPNEKEQSHIAVANGVEIAMDHHILEAKPSMDISVIKEPRKMMAEAVVEVSVISQEVVAQNVEEVVSEVVEPEKPQNTPLTIEQQIAENKYLAMDDTPKQKRKMVLGASSNLLALTSSNTPLSSYPSFSSGRGSTSSYSIRTIEEPTHSIPVTIGLQVQIPIYEKFSLGVGANYTILTSRYDAIINNSDEALVNQILRYVGVPVSAYFTFLQNDKLKFYCNAGALVEKGLQARYRMEYISGEKPSIVNEKISGLQWSVNAGLGFEYKFIDLLGIYLDPSVAYFFDNDQPFSIRKEQPLQLKFELGLRFHL